VYIVLPMFDTILNLSSFLKLWAELC